MLSRRLGSYYTDIYIENGKTFLPDLIIYNMDENEYKNFWQSIKNQRKGRLYSDGIEVYPVSWFGALFQSFKGWLGFQNYCDPLKVEMTLAKIAYHGYLKGFNSQPFQEHPTVTLPNHFKELIKSKRNNETSAALQQQLMNYYVTNSAHFPNSSEYEPTSRFGRFFVQNNLFYLIPSIDAQDKHVIDDSIWVLSRAHYPITPQDGFPLSTFHERYARFLVKQEKLAEALKWSQNVKTLYKEKFIDFFIANRRYDTNAAPNAFELIAGLFTENPIKAVNYARDKFSEQDRLTYLKAYPLLSQGVAKSYLQEAVKEKTKFMSSWRSSKLIPLLSHAVYLDPNIAHQDTSMQDVMMKEEWIIYQFNDAIQRKLFPQARALYEKHPKLKFNKDNLTFLSNYCAEQVLAKMNIMTTALQKADISLAEATAFERIKLAKIVTQLTPGDKAHTTATIDCASTLVQIDEINNPKVQNANLEQLDNAENLIKSFSTLDPNNTYLRNTLNQILLRKIDCLRKKVEVPRIFNDDDPTRTEFVAEHQDDLAKLQSNLNKFVLLNKDNKENAFRPILAKMYYLLGDILIFFFRIKNDKAKSEATTHFKKASEIMPENLYYQYRYCQLAKKERLHELEEQFKKTHDMHMTSYVTYMEQRWNNDQDPNPGIDIHGVPAEDRGVVATLSRVFS